jgi:hypothetical protein
MDIKTGDAFADPRIASPDRVFVIQSSPDTGPNDSLSKEKFITRVSPVGIKPPEALITLDLWTLEFSL